MVDNRVAEIALKIMKAHMVSREGSSAASTSYFDLKGNQFDHPGTGRIALSNRTPANFQGVCDAVLYELVLQDQASRLAETR